MARKQTAKVIDPHGEALRPYLEGVAKKVAHDFFGPQGPKWGTSLTKLKELALQTRAILTEEILAISLDPQATTPVEARPVEMQACPSCQEPFGMPEPQTVTTRAGEAAWSESKEFCTRCRRAFFRSEQKPGH